MKLRLLFCTVLATLLLAGCESVPESNVNALPVQIVRNNPQYPFELRQQGITGSAVVEFIVSTTGDVVEAHAVSATHPAFGAAAVAAVYRWKFKPAVRNGRPVNVRMQIPVGFDLSPDTPAPSK